MGILLCEQNFRDIWIRNKSVRAEIGQILHTDTHPHTHTTAAKLVVRICPSALLIPRVAHVQKVVFVCACVCVRARVCVCVCNFPNY